jgi:hypothetical protein
MTKRRAPNKTEKIAALLLTIKRGDGWLIPEPLRSSGDAKAICAHCQWDHLHPHSLGGDTSPQNMDPKDKLEHKGKTRRDMMKIAKAKRIEKQFEENRRRMLARDEGDLVREKPKKRKQKMPFGRNDRRKKKLTGEVVMRELTRPSGSKRTFV